MRILLDEDVPIQVLALLDRVLKPHEVHHVQRIRWKGKGDLFLFADAAARGYNVLLTNDHGQLSDPRECDAIKKAGFHHVRYDQRPGLRGLALAVAAIVAAMPDLVEELENESAQRLVRIIGLDPRRKRFEIVDPQREPPAYWPRCNAVGLAVPVLRQPGGVDAAGRAQQRGPPPGAGRHPAARHAGGVLAGGPRPARPAAAGELALELSNTAFHPAALTAPGGQVTVELTNHDLFWHSFTIEQPAVNVDIPVGGVRRVALTLPPGSYRFYCRVPGHRQAGMVGTLRVG